MTRHYPSSDVVTIKRSMGIYTGYVGYFAGAGYSGATQELDDIVMRMADWLAAEYNVDVSIRYNTDRQSGGAWIKDGGQGWDADTTVGMCAGLRSHDLFLATNVKAPALRDPTLATRDADAGSRSYAWVEHKSIEAAVAWMRDNVVWPITELTRHR